MQTIMDIMFWDFLILYQIFFSPQVKRSVIISNKHCTYNKPQELPNDLRLYSILTENCWKIEIKAFPHCAIPHENQSLPPFTRPMTAAIKPARKKFKATKFMKAGMKMHFVKNVWKN